MEHYRKKRRCREEKLCRAPKAWQRRVCPAPIEMPQQRNHARQPFATTHGKESAHDKVHDKRTVKKGAQYITRSVHGKEQAHGKAKTCRTANTPHTTTTHDMCRAFPLCREQCLDARQRTYLPCVFSFAVRLLAFFIYFYCIYFSTYIYCLN
jgi:hypothetical protein